MSLAPALEICQASWRAVTMPPTMEKRAGKRRADVLLLERGLAESRERAQALILAGQVFAGQRKVQKPGESVAVDAELRVEGDALRFASRGGWKLAGALEDFVVEPRGRVCMDVGSSTGGFTDCLLQRGARLVYAVDVNTAQLDWKLRQDARVRLVEANARNLRPEEVAVAGKPELVVVDVSFISVTKILPAILACAADKADFLILVKPQFELGRSQVRRGGVVRDAELQQEAVAHVTRAAEELGLRVLGVRPSRLKGTEGNQEFFLHGARSRE